MKRRQYVCRKCFGMFSTGSATSLFAISISADIVEISDGGANASDDTVNALLLRRFVFFLERRYILLCLHVFASVWLSSCCYSDRWCSTRDPVGTEGIRYSFLINAVGLGSNTNNHVRSKSAELEFGIVLRGQPLSNCCT